ncbi:hypothetical protein MaudCBS49596_003126 [Microsporum audouinii]
MMFPSSKLFALALTLAGCISASPTLHQKRDGDGDNVIIGYRAVSSEQAEMYRKAGKVVFTGAEAGTQIGVGVYLTNKPRGWKEDQPWHWRCVITANAKVVERIAKVWVPRRIEGRPELWNNVGAIDEYIESLPHGYDPKKTMRLSYITGYGDRLQLLIPEGLVDDPELNLTPHCEDNLEFFDGWRHVDWEKEKIWTKNSGGSKEPGN